MSFEKFILDTEIAGIMRRFRRGIEIDEDSLLLRLSRRLAPVITSSIRNYTLTHHKTEFRKPLLSDRQSFEGWSIESLTAEDRAYQLCQKMIDDYEDPGLDESLQKELQSYRIKKKSS